MEVQDKKLLEKYYHSQTNHNQFKRNRALNCSIQSIRRSSIESPCSVKSRLSVNKSPQRASSYVSNFKIVVNSFLDDQIPTEEQL